MNALNHKSLRHIFAYAGTVALVMSIALFPAPLKDATLLRFKTLVSFQESVARLAEFEVASNDAVGEISALLLLLLMCLGLIAFGARASKPFSHVTSRIPIITRYARARLRWILPEIRGPAL